MRAWPKVASLGLGLIPVAVLTAMLASIVFNALPAITDAGISELASTKFFKDSVTGETHYGLLPTVWGSVEVMIIAMALALPVSLAMAIFAAELAPGRLGGAMRMLLGLMSGIPPIVYALMAVLFVAPFMIPKFTGNLSYSDVHPEKIGFTPAQWPPPDVPWSAGAFAWDRTGINNSVLLGGIMLALLAIPFMAPLIEDALHNVPGEPKQASLALGAGQWRTLTRITLPHALSGIISAVRLGALKVLGDVMIVLFVVGFAAPRFPDPPWDVLERNTPLTALGSGLIGGFTTSGTSSCQSTGCSVGYFAALVLLVLAFVIVGLTAILERKFRRKFSA